MSQHHHLPADQHQYQVKELGKPLEAIKVPVRPPGNDEITIEIHASSVNPLDNKLQTVNYFNAPLPYPVGFDLAGKVVAVGSDVKQFSVGDRVFGMMRGAFGHYATGKPSQISKMDNFTYHDAAAWPVAGQTTYEALYVQGDIPSRKGQTIFIAGGAGGCGHYAVQLALYEGLTVIASGGKPESLALLKQLGVHHIIDYHKQDTVGDVLKLTDSKGADLVLDTTYEVSSFKQSAGVVAKGGKWIRIGKIGEPDKPAVEIVEKRGGTAAGGDYSQYMAPGADNSRVNQGYVLADKLYGENKLKPHVSKKYKLHEVNTALDELKSGKAIGKIVVEMK